MHELGVVRSIYDIVMDNAKAQHAGKVVSVNLVIGKVRNLERYWVQKYFDQCADGSIAEGAMVNIDYVPITFYCRDCGETYARSAHEIAHGHLQCPKCGASNAKMLTGGELLIKSIEVA